METEWVVVEEENQAAEEEGMGMGWKALFLRRAVMADASCRAAHGLLEGLVAAFGEQESLEMARGGRSGEEEETRRALEAASAELGLTAAHIGAARHLALRCRARPSPADRPPPLSDCSPARAPAAAGDEDEGLLADPEVRRALGLLREAAGLVRAVHDLVESARGHLGAAGFLRLALGDNYDDGRDAAAAAPWLHGPCAGSRLGGVLDVAQAWAHATELAETTQEARDAAFAFSDD